MSDLLKKLRTIIGDENVITASEELAFYSMDAFWTGPTVTAVIRPGSVVELSEAVKTVIEAGHAVVPRGGGMSYTKGYVPMKENSITLDMTRMNQIVEINRTDMYATVQGGCTWQTLYEALKEQNLRLPFFGPLSGSKSTVGGSLANNSMFFGSGTYGSAADNVLALSVVLADGSVVKTGTKANKGDHPFNRYFGPDLTGLFLSDGGSLGIKAEVSFKLIVNPESTEFASFGFDTFNDMFDAQTEIGRTRTVAECMGMDPFLNRKSKLKGPKEAVDIALAVSKSRGSIKDKVRDIVGMASGGTRFLESVPYSLHVTVDGLNRAHSESILEKVRSIAGQKGQEIANSIPKAIRAAPFRPVGEFLVGQEGERWVPIHALVPFSKGKAINKAVRDYFDSRQADLDKYNIQTSQLTAIEGASVIIEPAFYYPDKLKPYHLRYLSEDLAKKYKEHPEVPGANEAVVEMLRELSEVFLKMGAAHHQIGKFYPYRDSLSPETLKMIMSIKQITDPKGLLNPGVLGMDN